MTNRRAPAALLAAMASLLAFGLTGCSDDQIESTPQENRDKLSTLFDETEVLIGGEWESSDDPAPRPCQAAGGEEGVQYTLRRNAPGIADANERQRLAEAVAKLWEPNGYDVRQTTRTSMDLKGVEANNDQYSMLSFGVNPHATLFSGESDCTPGDLGEILEQLK